MIYVYSDSCLPCTNKSLWKSIRLKAIEHKELVKRMDINKDPKAKEDANVKYGFAIPFIVKDGIPKTVEEFLV